MRRGYVGRRRVCVDSSVGDAKEKKKFHELASSNASMTAHMWCTLPLDQRFAEAYPCPNRTVSTIRVMTPLNVFIGDQPAGRPLRTPPIPEKIKPLASKIVPNA